MIARGWRLYYYRIFKAALDELELAVSKLAANDPEGYKTHPKTKLLASIYRAITQLVPANPDAPDFRLGKTLGSDNTHWRRVKKGRPSSECWRAVSSQMTSTRFCARLSSRLHRDPSGGLG